MIRFDFFSSLGTPTSERGSGEGKPDQGSGISTAMLVGIAGGAVVALCFLVCLVRNVCCQPGGRSAGDKTRRAPKNESLNTVTNDAFDATSAAVNTIDRDELNAEYSATQIATSMINNDMLNAEYATPLSDAQVDGLADTATQSADGYLAVGTASEGNDDDYASSSDDEYNQPLEIGADGVAILEPTAAAATSDSDESAYKRLGNAATYGAVNISDSDESAYKRLGNAATYGAVNISDSDESAYKRLGNAATYGGIDTGTGKTPTHQVGKYSQSLRQIAGTTRGGGAVMDGTSSALPTYENTHLEVAGRDSPRERASTQSDDGNHSHIRGNDQQLQRPRADTQWQVPVHGGGAGKKERVPQTAARAKFTQSTAGFGRSKQDSFRGFGDSQLGNLSDCVNQAVVVEAQYQSNVHGVTSTRALPTAVGATPSSHPPSGVNKKAKLQPKEYVNQDTIAEIQAERKAHDAGPGTSLRHAVGTDAKGYEVPVAQESSLPDYVNEDAVEGMQDLLRQARRTDEATNATEVHQALSAVATDSINDYTRVSDAQIAAAVAEVAADSVDDYTAVSDEQIASAERAASLPREPTVQRRNGKGRGSEGGSRTITQVKDRSVNRKFIIIVIVITSRPPFSKDDIAQNRGLRCVLHQLLQAQAAEEVIWADDFRFSLLGGFLVPNYFCFYFNFFGEIGYQKTSGENLIVGPNNLLGCLKVLGATHVSNIHHILLRAHQHLELGDTTKS